MRVTTWNLDHPIQNTKRFDSIRDYLLHLDADVLILTEANAALHLPGYTAVFSEESPYLRRGRNMDPPNRYHQVGIYAKGELRKLPEIHDINEVAAEVDGLRVYGCVFTIKDRWATWSDKTYRDRVQEQCAVIRQLAGSDFLLAGDFNFRGTGSYNRVGAKRVRELAVATGLAWPTEREDRSVQHLLHSPDLQLRYSIDDPVTLSDHPVVWGTLAL
ncbi:endonuclease/exonuclease/phosphatase family protein [Neolewinella xylanilytica]|uniref:Endonuclease/exonuclease/phosphatase family protein n=1 Tax=Neolewinella xylanilytica TaxID=1514080 RepID=A0A2S6IA33_9BACT|nr:endonuclease/exonuclease/phosphatase family protein [Neolewinella xylanilytica]PPK88364.1 endonuclease/exonuclease/phosphatase family protein [Neolewinella xylanilytica]